MLHPCFTLSGNSYSRDELHELGYSLIKEGDSFEIAIGDFLVDWLSPSSTIAVKTSGSTGKPKTIILEKEFMVNSAFATGAFFNLKPKDTALLCLSANYIAGKMMLVRAMILGLQLDYVAASENPLHKNTNKYDFCAMVPLQVEASLEQLKQLKKLIVGGAPMSYTLKKKVQVLSTQVFETYGMTETITHIAIKSISNSDTKETYFKTLANVVISQDKRGCLVISAPKLAGDIIVTNDIVKLISKTEFVWLGRFDNVINSGGIKLFPEEIEKKLAPFIVPRFFVIGIPNQKLGQELVLLIEGKANKNKLLKVIKSDANLNTYSIPKQIICIPEFAENNGKVLRRKTLSKLPK